MVSLLIAILFIPFSSSFAETINYTYDDLNRLSIIEYGTGSAVVYTYDEVSNWLQKSTVPTYTITASAVSNGSITPTSTTDISGATQTFTITPASGYELSSLLDNGSNVTSSAVWNGSTYTYTIPDVTSDQNIRATFVVGSPPPPVVQNPALSTPAGFLLALTGLGIILRRRRKENGETQSTDSR